MAKTDLTAVRLRELLDYNPDTGVFTWKSHTVAHGKKGKRMLIGSEAGGLDGYGYRKIGLFGSKYAAHNLAWLYVKGEWPRHTIDHINGIRTDNRIENLRDVSRRINNENLRSARSHNRSGMLGAYYHKFSGLYGSRITVQGREISLGYFKTAQQAHDAYIAAKRRLHEGCTI